MGELNMQPFIPNSPYFKQEYCCVEDFTVKITTIMIILLFIAHYWMCIYIQGIHYCIYFVRMEQRKNLTYLTEYILTDIAPSVYCCKDTTDPSHLLPSAGTWLWSPLNTVTTGTRTPGQSQSHSLPGDQKHPDTRRRLVLVSESQLIWWT